MVGARQDLQRAVHELAYRQAGYFTAAQALAAGYSYQAQKHHADTGNWIRVDRGIFRLPGWPAEPEDVYVRWALWSRGRGVISHESALALHGLSDVNPRRIHLTVGPDFHARDDAVVLHVADLRSDEVDARGSWSLTTVERTLADVARELEQELLVGAVRDALASGRITRRRLLRLTSGLEDRAALRLERALTEVSESSE